MATLHEALHPLIPEGNTFLEVTLFDAPDEQFLIIKSVGPDGRVANTPVPMPLVVHLIENYGATKEAARKNDQFYVVSKRPDWCKSPEKAVPYQVVADLSEGVDCSPNVRYTGSNAVIFAPTYTPTVKGDAKGEGGGVKSNTFLDTAQTAAGSTTVKVNGSQQVRVDDKCYLNCKNTFGPVKTKTDSTPLGQSDAEQSEEQPEAQNQGGSQGNKPDNGRDGPSDEKKELPQDKAAPDTAEASAGEKFDEAVSEINKQIESVGEKAKEIVTTLNDLTGGDLAKASQWANEQLEHLDIQALKDISAWADETLDGWAEAAGMNRPALLTISFLKAAKEFWMPENVLDIVPGTKTLKKWFGKIPDSLGKHIPVVGIGPSAPRGGVKPPPDRSKPAAPRAAETAPKSPKDGAAINPTVRGSNAPPGGRGIPKKGPGSPRFAKSDRGPDGTRGTGAHKGHSAKHGSAESGITDQAYYDKAVDNMNHGNKFRYWHDGQFKNGYLTPVGDGKFLFTATTANNKYIFSSFVVNQQQVQNLVYPTRP